MAMWMIVKVIENSSMFHRFMETEWEPFSVVRENETNYVWLRKKES